MAILDNRSPPTRVGGYLCELLGGGGAETLRIVSAYFTVYAYGALQDELDNAGAVRFLYGDPGSVGEVDPGAKDSKDFKLTEEGLLPQKLLQQKRLAKECEEWINKRVEIRTIKQANFLHGKMYHFERAADADAAVVGSSNFTHRGLGFTAGANIELNLQVSDAATCDELKQWFDGIWHDEHLTTDAKGDVLDALRRLGENYSPELVYFKTLLEVFRDRVEGRDESDAWLNDKNIKDTQIWNTLFQFQKDGVAGVINRLQQHKGCILADSVGLGKTYTALAVIRYYEAKNQRVLVLCPKKLSENWKLYPAHYGQQRNPFKEDNFQYAVLHHTDLSRRSGESNGINLDGFDWSAYGLVVIDESHNFRNESSSARDDEGNIIRQSRYERLLQDVIRQGGETRVLMLSATPVNTSLENLRNQVYFMTGKQDDFFSESLGIKNIRTMLGRAQKQFKQWEQQGDSKDKRELLDTLGGDFFTLLDAVSIARSRRHIKKFYPEVVEKIGGFPVQATPEHKHTPTDAQGELSYEALTEEIQQFNLSLYTPATYVISGASKRSLEEEKKRLNFNQQDLERLLIGMIQVNFLKRLESAAPSLEKTLGRTISKVEEQMAKIQKYQAREISGAEVEMLPDEDFEDDDFIVNKARHSFHFEDMDLPKWLDDLQKDLLVLQKMRAGVGAITPQRDQKLTLLKEKIRAKLRQPTTDKDGRENRKVLVFTAFKDTAVYLYEQLEPLIAEMGAHYALVAGDETQTTHGRNNFNDILTNFAPVGRNRRNRDGTEIDVLIATDCISEGQNLQDCDWVLNYDIHWNPVRLVQRFGRIDRIGSRNNEVKMINFWPTQELDNYLRLKPRVEARMALMDATATGDEPAITEAETREDAEMEVSFRDAQIRRLYDSMLDLDDIDDGVALSDFSLDDFLAQLMNYLEQNKKQLERIPPGVYALADCAQTQPSIFAGIAAPGVIFCLKQKTPPPKNRVRSPLNAYYLVYVRDDGEVRYNYTHAKQTLELFAELARGRTEPLLPLCDAFDFETDNGRKMEKYDDLLEKVIKAISRQFERQAAQVLGERGGIVPTQSEKPQNADDFELVTWLVIKDSESVAGN